MTPTDVRNAFWLELAAILDAGFTGSIVLHANEGRVVKYEKHETLRPKNGVDRLVETKKGAA